jgi:DNA (cytosine-5)-methyltransferase 1
MAVRDRQPFAVVSSTDTTIGHAEMTSRMGSDDARYLRGKRPRTNGRHRGTLSVADLFSGIGGLTLGVEEACRQIGFGVQVRLAVECRPQIAMSYATNFEPAMGATASGVTDWFDRNSGAPLSAIERLTRSAVGPVDILIGGPPCQGHSTLNNYTRGNDPRNDLYQVMVRAAEVLEPRCILIENVPAVERDARGTLDRALNGLSRLGFHVDNTVLSVAEIGVPQLRKRHVLAGHQTRRPSLALAIAGAQVRRVRTVRWAIHDLLDIVARKALDVPSLLSRENTRRIRHLFANGLYDLPNRLRPPCQRGRHKYKSMYGRLSWDLPAQTITTGFASPGQGRYIHPHCERALTPHEAARLQFLPDWLDLSTIRDRTSLAEAIGNAVPPKLGFVVASHLLQDQRAVSATDQSARVRLSTAV